MGNKWQLAALLLGLQVSLEQHGTFAKESKRKLFPKSEGLSLEEFDKILHTDIIRELQVNRHLKDDKTIKGRHKKSRRSRESLSSIDLWNAATEMEWEYLNDRSENLDYYLDQEGNEEDLSGSYYGIEKDEEVVDSLSPFIICDPEPKSGHKAKIFIQNYFKQNFNHFVQLQTIYNREMLTCFVAEISGEMAASVESPLKVQPVFPEMKIAKGLVDSIAMREPGMDDDKIFHRITVTLCPGIGGTKEKAMDIGKSIIESLHFVNPSHRMMRQSTKNRILRRNLMVQAKSQSLNSTATLAFNFHDSRARSLIWSRALEEGLDTNKACREVFTRTEVSGTQMGDTIVVTFEEHPATSSLEVSASSCILAIVATFASDPQVCDIGKMPQVGINNVNAQWITQSDVPNQRPWFDSGLTGKGQVVGVSDSGIDMDNCYFWDSKGSFNADGSVDQSRRKIVKYDPFVDAVDFKYNGHGTHVAGTIAGHRAVDGKTESNGNADGVAKDAKIAMFDIAKPGRYSLPPDISDVFDSGKSAGANIHSASWGASSESGYGLLNKYFDGYSYSDDNFLAIVAAGNHGYSSSQNQFDMPNTIFEPASAKNVLTVGSSQNAGYRKGHDYISYFSSRGPTFDGRTKPDIIAPGQPILSAASRGHLVGECDDTWGTSNKFGTSMATPVVSGTAALVRQYFEDGYYPTGKQNHGHQMVPSGALVKAVLINGAQALQGVDNVYHETPSSEYDTHQNFGRISLADSLKLDGKNTLKTLVYDRKVIKDGETEMKTVKINMNGGCVANKLSVTLVWMDPPAPAQCTECLINNLDLFIKKRGHGMVNHPNGLMTPDSKNTAERIKLDASNGEIFDVYVKGTDLEGESQKYALVISGCVEELGNNPPPPPPVVCEDGPGQFLLSIYNKWRTCHWLKTRKPKLKKRLIAQNCKPGKSGWDLCKETCGRC